MLIHPPYDWRTLGSRVSPGPKKYLKKIILFFLLQLPLLFFSLTLLPSPSIPLKFFYTALLYFYLNPLILQPWVKTLRLLLVSYPCLLQLSRRTRLKTRFVLSSTCVLIGKTVWIQCLQWYCRLVTTSKWQASTRHLAPDLLRASAARAATEPEELQLIIDKATPRRVPTSSR